MRPSLLLLVFALSLTPRLFADGVGDNSVEKVRPVPPPGKPIPAADRADLESGLKELQKDIDDLKVLGRSKPIILQHLPDVAIFHKAVHDALAYDEIYNPTNEIKAARALLATARDRASALRDGNPSWLRSTGLVVRAYTSKIDGSLQPYGLVIPASYQPAGPQKHRLDAWFHGRGENLTELNFLYDRMRNPGEFTPPDAIVLHLYGRYCNANKLAGEVDLFEALDHVRQSYRIDENRLVMRGFSMGGAACWQFAVHYASQWAAAAPGAGFSETPDFLKVFQSETLQPSWFEKKLWHVYDCTDYALNLFNCPTVAYSGEIDKQKQAADVMAVAMKKQGLELVHLIGPETAHKYHPITKLQLNERIDQIVQQGRNPVPRSVKLQTYTLRYNEMFWLTLDAMEEHWEESRVDADIQSDARIVVRTRNARALSFQFKPGQAPFDATQPVPVELDGQKLTAPKPLSDRSWTAHFRKDGKKWTSVIAATPPGLEKRHGLQGPIDDAFLDSFIMVAPSGPALNAKVGGWVDAEMNHAMVHWRKQFRGEARKVADNEVTDDMIARSNLILWGDPSSNRLIKELALQLPIQWTAEGVRVAGKTLGSADHALVLVYPNPKNPNRYIVLNSGFTFREYDYLNNARQVPKLPDYAIIDLKTPPNARFPGAIADAGFFGERWELKPQPTR